MQMHDSASNDPTLRDQVSGLLLGGLGIHKYRGTYSRGVWESKSAGTKGVSESSRRGVFVGVGNALLGIE
jgi:hypothetical protein